MPARSPQESPGHRVADSNAETVPNPGHALLPGMYLQVRFQFDKSAKIVRVPGAAVITRAEGTKVALVDPQGTVRYRSVQVGRDYGHLIEITNGLEGGENLIVRPGDDLVEGTSVETVTRGSGIRSNNLTGLRSSEFSAALFCWICR